MIGPALLAVAVAWIAGGAIVGLAWPRRVSLPPLAWLSLAGVLGPFVVGSALLACGSLDLPAAVSVPVITALGVVACAWAAWRRSHLPLPAGRRPPLVVLIVLAAAIAWSSGIAGRTHLGWDGTVVWYHKARILAATGGAMPSATLADQTRAWTAPDYPLHVPLALAWVRLWQPVEDERAIKVLPAAWCAALLLLVAAAVLERSRSATWAVAAVVVLATMPRLLIGEGSLTSGYGDGALAAVLAALLWIVWRSDDEEAEAWWPLLALLALAAVGTKQEGIVAVVAAAAWRAWHGQRGHGQRGQGGGGPGSRSPCQPWSPRSRGTHGLLGRAPRRAWPTSGLARRRRWRDWA